MKITFLHTIKIYVYTFLVTIFLLCVVSACSFDSGEEGVVAAINGHSIYFVDLEAQRNMLFSGLDRLGNPPSDKELKVEYSYSLRQLLIQELVRQYLEEINDLPPEQLVQEEIEKNQKDYGGDFIRNLEESGISPRIWKDSVRRQVLVDYFVDTVLKPKVIISSEEVESYYLEHKDEFVVPEQWHFVELLGRDKENVEKAQLLFITSQNATEVQKTFDVRVREIKMGKNRLSERAFKYIATLTPMQAGAVVKEGEGFLTRVLLSTSSERSLEVLETYKRIESALTEDRLSDAFIQWINAHIEKSNIKIAKKLLPFTPLESLNKKLLSNGTLGNKNSTEENIPEALGVSQD